MIRPDAVVKYQRLLLDQAQQIYRQTPISEPTARAFLATPRHLFVDRYRERASQVWFEVRDDNFLEHVAALYADRPLILSGDDDDSVRSTISQPSFVLRMLDLLQVRPGQSVLELGAGSAWNAALLGQLAGPTGTVHSVEIIPDLAERAAGTIERLGITNVRIVHGDGGEGHAAAAPYDRIVFTAGTYDLPRPLYAQIKDGGLLLAPFKQTGGGDHLFVLRKVHDHFESVDSTPCGFVQLTGKYGHETLDPVPIETTPQWAHLQVREVARRPFWWGGKGWEWFQWMTAGIRSFLGITEPTFRTYVAAGGGPGDLEEAFFGLWDQDWTSLVLARQDELISYGSMAATERLLRAVHAWVDLGMPTAASFTLEVYPGDRPVTVGARQWRVVRPESQFLWRLGA